MMRRKKNNPAPLVFGVLAAIAASGIGVVLLLRRRNAAAVAPAPAIAPPEPVAIVEPPPPHDDFRREAAPGEGRRFGPIVEQTRDVPPPRPAPAPVVAAPAPPAQDSFAVPDGERRAVAGEDEVEESSVLDFFRR